MPEMAQALDSAQSIQTNIVCSDSSFPVPPIQKSSAYEQASFSGCWFGSRYLRKRILRDRNDHETELTGHNHRGLFRPASIRSFHRHGSSPRHAADSSAFHIRRSSLGQRFRRRSSSHHQRPLRCSANVRTTKKGSLTKSTWSMPGTFQSLPALANLP